VLAIPSGIAGRGKGRRGPLFVRRSAAGISKTGNMAGIRTPASRPEKAPPSQDFYLGVNFPGFCPAPSGFWLGSIVLRQKFPFRTSDGPWPPLPGRTRFVHVRETLRRLTSVQCRVRISCSHVLQAWGQLTKSFSVRPAVSIGKNTVRESLRRWQSTRPDPSGSPRRPAR
jgi:hypothetical protein